MKPIHPLSVLVYLPLLAESFVLLRTVEISAYHKFSSVAAPRRSRYFGVRASDLGAPGLDQPVQEKTEKFDFHKQWYPMAVTEFLEAKKPHQVQLLGKDLVIWRDSRAGEWRAFEDACPHRRVPLSEGRVEPDGTLLCAYHAWRFRGDGVCTSIPQAKKQDEARLCSSPKACAVTHPTMERQGLLWVWGQPGGAGSDAAIMSKSLVPSQVTSLESLYDFSIVCSIPLNLSLPAYDCLLTCHTKFRVASLIVTCKV